ncbi:hypothetical protein ACRRTK_004194 [Alexandromys fortis]
MNLPPPGGEMSMFVHSIETYELTLMWSALIKKREYTNNRGEVLPAAKKGERRKPYVFNLLTGFEPSLATLPLLNSGNVPSEQWEKLLGPKGLNSEERTKGNHRKPSKDWQASSADLMIRNILLMHAGRYGCRVQTTADSVSDEAELLVREPQYTTIAVPVRRTSNGGDRKMGRDPDDQRESTESTWYHDPLSMKNGREKANVNSSLSVKVARVYILVGPRDSIRSASTRLEREVLDVNPVAGRIAKEDKRTLHAILNSTSKIHPQAVINQNTLTHRIDIAA